MFKKLKTIITDFAEKIGVIKTALTNSTQRIMKEADYSDDYKLKECARLKDTYRAERKQLTDQGKAAIAAVFDDLFASFDAAITADVGQDAFTDLRTLADASPSDYEINAYAKKYSGKYRALRELSESARAAGIPFSFVPEADMRGALNDLRGKCERFLDVYEGEQPVNDYYMRMLYMSATDTIRDGNMFANIERMYTDFTSPTVRRLQES